MKDKRYILINHLNYINDCNHIIFKDLTLKFNQNKTAIIGRNGVGKTTLLKLIIGELQPTSGEVKLSGSISYCPQNFSSYLNKSVAEIMGIEKKLEALNLIEKGIVDPKLFEIVDEDWNFKLRFVEQLRAFNINKFDHECLLSAMSGGEITRVFLAKVFFEDKDFIILDEPTNNLDSKSRDLLYEAINKWNKGLIVVSHDRHLLELFNRIIEITTIGINSYGGNYNYYLEQKKISKIATQHHYADTEKQLKNVRKRIQETREKHERRESKGSKMRKLGSESKLLLNSMRERSEKTKSKLNIKEERLLKTAEQHLQDAKEKTEVVNKIKVNLPKTYVPSNKLIVEVKNVTFFYEPLKNIINNYSLIIRGAERVAFLGDNGSGKTTLAKLITGALKPCCGEIIWGTKFINYLDQDINILDDKSSLLDNYLRLNPKIKMTEARYHLSNFIFRNEDALKLIENMSRGEKLRAGLCCVLTSNEPPQLLILDEPTNHLDIDSILILEAALNCYQGALIVVSHDYQFINNIGVTKTVLFNNK